LPGAAYRRLLTERRSENRYFHCGGAAGGSEK